MRSVVDILEELESTPGKLAKLDIVEAARKNALLKRVFVAVGDPYTVYYVNKFKMPSTIPARMQAPDDEVILDFLDGLLPLLAARKITGNDAKSCVTDAFERMSDLQQKWCQRIILKNLRVGLQESSVNKVWPGTLNSFAVALAKTLKSDFVLDVGIKLLEPVKYPVRVEPKLDGLRCIAVKKDGVVTFYTRNGTVLESMPKIKAALEAAKYDNIVLDGEGMAADWNESASVMMSGRGSNKDHKKDDSNLYYNVFDAMPLSDWVSQVSTMQYAARCKLVTEVVLKCVTFDMQAGEPARVRQVPHIMAKDEEQLKTFFAKCLDDGFEGVMLKTLDTPYVWDRSKNIMKLKPVITYEGVIVGNYEGRRGTKREGQFGGFYVMLPNHIITRVGGGFNDALRATIKLEDPDSWNGKIVECEAQPDPLTKDGLTEDGKMRFPVYCRNRDKSDVDPSVPATYKWWNGLKEEVRAQELAKVTRDKGKE
jgi:DNA ligase 1